MPPDPPSVKASTGPYGPSENIPLGL